MIEKNVAVEVVKHCAGVDGLAGLFMEAAITAQKLAPHSVGSSAIGTLNGLTVNGVVNATGFVASAGGGEEGGAHEGSTKVWAAPEPPDPFSLFCNEN